MNSNKKLYRIISWILCVCLCANIWTSGIITAFAQSDGSVPEISIEAALAEEIGENMDAVSDSLSKKASAGNWHVAVYVDGLPWSKFHKEVQKDILKKYGVDKIKLEMQVTYPKPIIKENAYTGKKRQYKRGYADVSFEKEDIGYLYEVKPYSFSVQPKKKLAESQLKAYVDSSPKYKKGTRSLIEDGECFFDITRTFKVYTEDIEYKIQYFVQDNGLILYKFQRHVKRRQKNPVPVTSSETSKVSSPVKAGAANDVILFPGNKNGNYGEDTQPDGSGIGSSLQPGGGGYMSHIYTSQKKEALKVLSSLNYVYVDWNCLNKDSERKYSDYQLINNLKNTSKNKGTLIILMHDTADVNKTYNILKESISYLKSEGYEFRNFYDFINNQF